jgi:hypothetical protein
MFCCGRATSFISLFFNKPVDITPDISPVSSTYNLRERKPVNYTDTTDESEFDADDEDADDERAPSSDE